MRFRILGSSSAGNSALLRTDGCTVLIDAGFSGKKLEGLLARAQTALHSVSAVFLTHEHGDHTAALRGLTRKHPDLKIFANADTARAVQDKLDRRLNWQIFETGRPFNYHDLEVTAFSIPHDAYDPVGYVFKSATVVQQAAMPNNCTDGITARSSHSTDQKAVNDNCRPEPAGAECDLFQLEYTNSPPLNDSAAGGHSPRSAGNGAAASPALPRSICWLTDLGYVTNLAREHARSCDLLVVEANHDPDLLERCETRSWSTKQRIRGRHGHLSNQAAYDLLAQTESPCWKHVCLVHISSECNRLDIVEKQFSPLRNGSRNLDIHIFDPASDSPGAEFDLRTMPHHPELVAPTTTASTFATRP